MSFGEGDLHERVDELESENAELRAVIADLWPRAMFTMTEGNRESWRERLAGLDVEVDAN